MCAVHCVQLLHTILHRTDLIIFSLALQTTAPMMSIWGKAQVTFILDGDPAQLPHGKEHSSLPLFNPLAQSPISATAELLLLSRSCQRHSVMLMQVDSATVESGNRYSVTELAQHQPCTAVMLTKGCQRHTWRHCWVKLDRTGPGRTLARAGRRFLADVHL